MTCKLLVGLIFALFCFSHSAQADLTGTQAIRDNIDLKLKDVDISSLSIHEKQAWLVDPVRLNLNMLVPIYGSIILDNTLYGNIRTPAYIFDWTLGGFIPLGLLLAAGFAGDQLSENRKRLMVSTAVGLYLITRVGVFITINEHIHEYNKYMNIRMGFESEDPTSVSFNLRFETEF